MAENSQTNPSLGPDEDNGGPLAEEIIISVVLRPSCLKQRVAEVPQAVFFYPAGLYDWEPLRHFADLCDTFIYCDLSIYEEEFSSGLHGLHAIGIAEIPQPEEICIDGGSVGLNLGIDHQPWLESFLTPHYREQNNAAINIIQGYGGPWGQQCRLDVNGREVMVYCFRAEAFRCYTALFTQQNVAPKVVCLKNSLGLRRFLDLDRWSAPMGRSVADSPQPELLITDLPRRPECDWPWRRAWREYPQWQAAAYQRQHPVTLRHGGESNQE